MKLAGKVAIVTGAGQGIGQGIVHCLAEEGADVAIVDINRDTAMKVADDVKTLGRKSLAIVADTMDSKQVTQAVRDIINTFGKVDILVNNVGGYGKTVRTSTGRQFVDITEEQWDESFELNLKTQFLMCRAVVPYFQKQQSGKIVNISSGAAWGVSGGGDGRLPLAPGSLVYGITKAGVVRFTRALAVDLAGDNINVNCVCPGVIYTPLWEWIASRRVKLDSNPGVEVMTPKEYFDKIIALRAPLKRAQTAEDIGHAVVFLASEDARNITGQSLNVDGGMVMQ